MEKHSREEYSIKSRVVDSGSSHAVVKGGFLTAHKAALWCKKNLPDGSWKPWGSLGLTRYYIVGYNK